MADSQPPPPTYSEVPPPGHVSQDPDDFIDEEDEPNPRPQPTRRASLATRASGPPGGSGGPSSNSPAQAQPTGGALQHGGWGPNGPSSMSPGGPQWAMGHHGGQFPPNQQGGRGQKSPSPMSPGGPQGDMGQHGGQFPPPYQGGLAPNDHPSMSGGQPGPMDQYEGQFPPSPQGGWSPNSHPNRGPGGQSLGRGPQHTTETYSDLWLTSGAIFPASPPNPDPPVIRQLSPRHPGKYRILFRCRDGPVSRQRLRRLQRYTGFCILALSSWTTMGGIVEDQVGDLYFVKKRLTLEVLEYIARYHPNGETRFCASQTILRRRATPGVQGPSWQNTSWIELVFDP